MKRSIASERPNLPALLRDAADMISGYAPRTSEATRIIDSLRRLARALAEQGSNEAH